MRLQQIRNATLKIEYGGQTILLDPWLQDKGTGFSANAARPGMNGVRSPLNALPMMPEEILDGVDFPFHAGLSAEGDEDRRSKQRGTCAKRGRWVLKTSLPLRGRR